jgi:defect-in-organelle-trafficking protein DotC
MDAVSLEALQQLSQPVAEQRVIDQSPQKNNFRLEALREAGVGVGARGALAQEEKKIDRTIEASKRNLDTIYDFSPLMIKGRVIPPVLTETREIYTQGDATTLRLAGRSYKVESQARFSSRPPQWRDYLQVSYGNVEMPSASLFPRNTEEQEVWRKAVADGWSQGAAQAEQIFTINLSRLNRDYIGMVRYHILAYKKMVSLPVVAELSMPINTSGGAMSLDETLLRITSLPEFNSNMKGWVPLGQENDRAQRPGDEPPKSQDPDGAVK